jgi:hypothetical protein
MTDIELLRRAAELIGLEIRVDENLFADIVECKDFSETDFGKTWCWVRWDPIADHGDLWRLADSLKVTVDFANSQVGYGDRKLPFRTNRQLVAAAVELRDSAALVFAGLPVEDAAMLVGGTQVRVVESTASLSKPEDVK